LGLSLRIVMSSIMRWRNGLIDLLESVMGLSPVLWVEVSQLQPQHRTGPNLKFIDNVKPWHQYRGSGLVLWPTVAIRRDWSCGAGVRQLAVIHHA
jgi:hypothetical protein